MALCIILNKYVLLALGLTTAACLAISIYAMLTKSDFTGFGAGLCMTLMLVCLVSILAIFLPREYG